MDVNKFHHLVKNVYDMTIEPNKEVLDALAELSDYINAMETDIDNLIETYEKLLVLATCQKSR